MALLGELSSKETGMKIQVVTLGTGTPRTDPGKAGAATAVVVDGNPYLFDFGPGVGERLTRAGELGVDGLNSGTVTRAFLTHMHSDHTTGLPDLLLTGWMFGREAPLEVYGPHGTDTLASGIGSAYRYDVYKRTHSEPHTEHGHMIEGHSVVPGTVYQDDIVTVEAFDVPHGSWPVENGPHPSMGYKLTAGDKSVIVSGDTGPFDHMAATYAGVDILVHEVYSSRGLSSRPVDWQAYHSLSHTSATELGKVSKSSQPGKVVMTHQLLWHADESEITDEIAAVYDGPVFYGHDLDVFDA
jgi:ribonuclease BN (tRNA processing enzyme)